MEIGIQTMVTFYTLSTIFGILVIPYVTDGEFLKFSY